MEAASGAATMISIHAPRGGSDALPGSDGHNFPDISIHAPRGGSDPGKYAAGRIFQISIHAPRGGSDKTGCLVG